MNKLTRSFLIAGSLGVGLYAVGAVTIHNAYAFTAKDSLAQNGGRGASLSQQTERMGREARNNESKLDRFIRERDLPAENVKTKDTNNGGSSDYGGDRTGGGGGPK